MYKLLIVLASTAALTLTVLLVDVVLNVDVPGYFVYWLGIALGAFTSFFWGRKKRFDNSDLNSPHVRARNASQLISDSDRPRR